MISAALLSMSACTESISELESGTVFQAVSESPSTKTELGEKTDGKYPVLWSEGDRIAVNGVVSRPLSAEEAGANFATFTTEKNIDCTIYCRVSC